MRKSVTTLSCMSPHDYKKAMYAERPHVLVVDDDERIRKLLCEYLIKEGFTALQANSAAMARQMLSQFSIDIMVCDVMMPHEDGITFIKNLRQAMNTIPVVMLTARGDPNDRITGLEAGADDYLPKPFEPKELLLRLYALLRRSRPTTNQQAPQKLKIGAWEYDYQAYRLYRDEEMVQLTDVEGKLFKLLADHLGQVVTRDQLYQALGLSGPVRTVDVMIGRLRRKIEPDPETPRHLLTLRGKGYQLRG